jgi:sulfotransferase famil protein
MPISHLHRAIFVHIPKTAGTSVEVVLGMHGDKQDIGIVPYFNQTLDQEHLYGRDLQHMTAARLKAALNDDAVFDSYFKFTVVRNPWDRLVSTCAWLDQKWAKGQALVPAEFDRLVRQMYAAFLAAKASSAPFLLSAHLSPQFPYVLDDELRLLVDFIARYENLPQDWRRICERLSVDIALPSRMKSHHRPYREYYSDQTREMVAEIYALDASLFDYAF